MVGVDSCRSFIVLPIHNLGRQPSFSKHSGYPRDLLLEQENWKTYKIWSQKR